MEKISKSKVLITGASGSIGSALAMRIYQMKPKKLILLDQDETGIFYISGVLRGAHCLVGDITNKKRVKHIFEKFKPDIVFHCAAYKHVSIMEEQKEEAIYNNIYGTKVLADEAIKNGVKKFVFLSTDKAVNPKGVMGKTKRVCEQYLTSLKGKTGFIIIRFGNVWASRGSVAMIFENKIRNNETIEITSPKMERYFIKMQEALTLIITSSEKGKDNELWVWDMGKPVKIIDLAKNMIMKSGKKIKTKITNPKPGERISEELFFKEEKPKKKGKFLIAKLPYKKININKLIKSI
jgi:FlaA1/EpsC-like NDP-sugar epimerase